jgi:hypothetical protein
MKKVLQYTIVIILGLIVLNGIGEINKTLHNILFNPIPPIDAVIFRYYFYISILSIFFGILIEWKAVLNIFAGHFKINLLIIPSVILLVVCLLPFPYKMLKFGMGMSYREIPHGIFLAPLYIPTTIIILNVLVGVLIVRSFHRAP